MSRMERIVGFFVSMGITSAAVFSIAIWTQGV